MRILSVSIAVAWVLLILLGGWTLVQIACPVFPRKRYRFGLGPVLSSSVLFFFVAPAFLEFTESKLWRLAALFAVNGLSSILISRDFVFMTRRLRFWASRVFWPVVLGAMSAPVFLILSSSIEPAFKNEALDVVGFWAVWASGIVALCSMAINLHESLEMSGMRRSIRNFTRLEDLASHSRSGKWRDDWKHDLLLFDRMVEIVGERWEASGIAASAGEKIHAWSRYFSNPWLRWRRFL